MVHLAGVSVEFGGVISGERAKHERLESGVFGGHAAVRLVLILGLENGANLLLDVRVVHLRL